MHLAFPTFDGMRSDQFSRHEDGGDTPEISCLCKGLNGPFMKVPLGIG